MKRTLLPALLALLLTACATVPPAPPVDGERVASLDEWTVRGRLSVRDNGDSWYGSLRWEQAADRYRVDLSGPLGQGSLRLEQDATGAMLQLAADRSYRGRSMESLLRRHLGWYLPVAGMRDWIKGQAAPGPVTRIERELDGAMKSLRQQGWTIDYDRYRAVDELVLPHKLRLVSGPLEVKLVIDRWELGTAGAGA